MDDDEREELRRIIDIVDRQDELYGLVSSLNKGLIEHMQDEKSDRSLIIQMASDLSAHSVQITALERMIWALIGAIGFMTISAVGYWIAFLMQHKDL